MKRWFILFAGLAAVCTAGEITLVERSLPKATIVVDEKAPPGDREAAEELMRFIGKATGARELGGPAVAGIVALEADCQAAQKRSADGVSAILSPPPTQNGFATSFATNPPTEGLN